MIYEYRCSSCDHITTVNRPMKNRNDPLGCEECGSPAHKVIVSPIRSDRVFGAADFPGYKCPVTDAWVDSARKRREIMARHDLRPHSSADQVKHHTGF